MNFLKFECRIIHFFIVYKMADFDIEKARTELEAYKQQYNDLMTLYSQVKSQSHPKQLFPSIEAKIYNIEQSIEKQSILISSYDDLQDTMKVLDGFEAEVKEWTKDLM
jgi:hypothetical protein